MYPIHTLTTRCPGLVIAFALATLIGCTREEAQPAASVPAPTAEEAPPAPSVPAPAEEAVPAPRGTIDKMQGTWQSQDDEAYVIEIEGDQFISWYDKEAISTETLRLVSACDDQSGDPEGEYFVVMDDADALCYYLIHVDETILEYSYVGRGNTLSFTKIE